MDPRAARIQQIGILLYGEAGWQARLARATGISVQHLSSIMTGARRVTPEVEGTIARKLAGEIIPHLQATEAHLRAPVSDIDAELGLELDPAGPSLATGWG